MIVAFRNGIMQKPYDAEVEYLESTGTQYIDTGFYFSPNIKVKFDCIFTDLYGDYLFGLNTGSYEVFWYNPTGDFYFGLGYSRIEKPQINTLYNIDLDFTAGAMVAKINGDIKRQTEGTQPASSFKIYIFGYNNRGVPSPSYTKLMDFSIQSSDGRKLIDLIPVRFTNENNQTEGAMYDKVSKQLFRNAGTGQFIIGEDVYSGTISGGVQ